MIWTVAFWKGLGERSIKTFAQTFVAVAILGLGVDAMGTTARLTDVLWLNALSVAALATLLSALTSIGNADFVAGPSSDA